MEKLLIHSNELERALLTLDRSKAETIIRGAVSEKSLIDVAGKLMAMTLHRIGESWEVGKLSLSRVYMSGLICEEIIDKLVPPSTPLRRAQPKMAIAVFEDYHLLGKRIIYSTLRASGFELMDLGGGLKTDRLVKIVNDEGIEILLLSVLMLPSALRVKGLKDKLAATGVKLVVGGAPFRLDSELWLEVGADACGRDSAEALEIVTRLAGENA
jgi:monomethylamine corrinoid protein